MSEQTYWVALGKTTDGTYAQSLIHLPQWRDSAQKDRAIVALVEITVDLEAGEVSADIVKNTVAPSPADQPKE